jgi:hypothetical protein
MKKSSLLIILMILLVTVGFAQPGNPGGGDPDVPITGIEILIGIGSAFGVSRFFKGKGKSNKPVE